ncbi:hypothetical protein AGMMS49545_21280 [Betaproteobacteria bacterium]|nr:hypothetical protein AGMMS49545_21280 [Betaproteobacteria bacterium]
MSRLLAALCFCLFSAFIHAADLTSLSNSDAVAGLRETLNKGAEAAIRNLGHEDGFLGNKKVRIPLPDKLQKAEKAMRLLGMQAKADELATAMNRAAELAVAKAKPVLTHAIKSMTVKDAKNILSGGDDAVTQYFRGATEAPLTATFLPIVKKATAQVKLAGLYNNYAGQAAQLGLLKKEDANLDDYVTRKALDGLFLIMAEEEKALRQNPVKAGSKILETIFGVK